MNPKNIAGMSLKGGRKDKFFFCLLEHFEDENRWFLKSLLQVKDESDVDGDDAIRGWIRKFNLTKLVVDTPLSTPSCELCALECPGAKNCPELSIKDVRKRIADILSEDAKLANENPKRYEQQRNKDDEFDFSKNVLSKETYQHILSKSFKRRLKKVFLPYWNRPVDLWVWLNYYDQLLKVFNVSYDSYGNVSLMQRLRFLYLKRHFPVNLELYEGNGYITLLELMRAKVVTRQNVVKLSDIEEGVIARLEVIKAVEERFNIFVYDHDLEILAKNIHAFDSFLLALSGQSIHLETNRELPSWSLPNQNNMVIPGF